MEKSTKQFVITTKNDPACFVRAQQSSNRLDLPILLIDNEDKQTWLKLSAQGYSGALNVTETELEFRLLNPTTTIMNFAPIKVDFIAGKLAHRKKYGGGRKQLLAKACGLHRNQSISVLDVTAGLGQDAFVLASLGAQVVMLERSPIVAALLQDGLERAQQVEWFKQLSLKLIVCDAVVYLQQLLAQKKLDTKTLNLPQTIYLDPMFPDLKKTALSKKEMQILQAILPDDPSEQLTDLLNLSLACATERVVLKRPRAAPVISEPKLPDVIYTGKSTRFDVYWPRKEVPDTLA